MLEKEVHMQLSDSKGDRVYDPVCGMELTGLPDLMEVPYEGVRYSFCGEGCKSRFLDNPKKFLGVPLLRLRGVKKTYRLGAVEVPVLRGLDLNIWEGDFVSIIGASGSGKSTVLNLVGLLDRPTEGAILFKGKDIARLSEEERAQFRSSTFGFVFQQYNLIPWLSAYENAQLPMIFQRGKKRNAEQKILQHFEEIGLGNRMTHRPFELSGGEQQRTALLRALANDPAVILGDEPTGNLDSETGHRILQMLVDLNKAQKKTLLIVTHDASIAGMADEIITIKDGRIERDHRIHRKIYTGA